MPLKIHLFFLLLAATAVMLSGCGSPITPSQTFTPSLPLANVTCNELSFFLDKALGDGWNCVTVPEVSRSDIPAYHVFIYPTHTELTIHNYPLTRTQFPPQVWIYPVSRFSELLPDLLPARLVDLKKIISNGMAGSGKMPFLPVNPQVQSFALHTEVIAFNGGKGVRFITEYSDAPLPVNNRTLIYTFQGLTDDGRYWVAVTLPIASPALPASSETLPEGYTLESLIQNYSAYLIGVKDALEAQSPGSFSPTLESLDNLAKSITVNR